MKRLLILFLLIALPCKARPWYRDWKAWAVIGASVGSSIAATSQAHHCRVHYGPAPCDGGYGEFKAREITRGITSLGMVSFSLWGRHQGFHEWAAPALGFAGYNTYVALQQSRVTVKRDLTGIKVIQ